MNSVLHCRFARQLSVILSILMVWPSIAMAASNLEKADQKPIVISNVPGNEKISTGKGEDARAGTKGIISRKGKEIAKFEITEVEWGYSRIKVYDVAPGAQVMLGDRAQITETPAAEKEKKKSKSSKWLSFLLVLGAIVALSSSGGGGGGDAGTMTITLSRTPTSLPADGASTSTVTATVVDGNNAAVADGTTVQFSGSMGSISPGEATTTGGTATATLTAGTTAGTCTVTATVGSQTANTTVSFVAADGEEGTILLAAAPTSIQVPGSGGPETESTITATCYDAGGSPATGGTVLFSSTLGSVTGSADINGSGVATATFSSNQTGVAEITATWAGTEATINVTVTAGPPYSINVTCTPAAIECNGNSFATVQAEVLDIAGNAVTDGTVVTFSVQADVNGGGNGTITPQSGTANGTATALLYSRDAGGSASIPGTATVVAQVEIAEQPAGIPVPATDLEDHRTQVQFVSQDVAFINVASEDHNIRGWDFINNTTEIVAIAYDSQNNPVPDGTAVYFTVDHGMIYGNSGKAGSVAMSVTENGLAPATLVTDASGDGTWNGWVDVTATCGNETVTAYDLVCFSGPAYAPNCSADMSKYVLAGCADSAVVTVVVLDVNGNPVTDDTVVEFTTTKGEVEDSSLNTTSGVATTTLTTSTTEAGPGELVIEIKGLPGDAVVQLTLNFTVTA